MSQPDTLAGSPTSHDGSGDSTEASSLSRTPLGFRDTDVRPAHDTTTPPPVSISALLDSAELSLPDTSEFVYKKYRVHYTPDYVGRPTIGYARDNFGSGVFGSSTIVLSDLLGNHSLIFSGFVNGRISEAQVDALYLNQAHRINWAAGFSQAPYYFFEPSEVILNSPDSTQNTLVTNLRRLVVRSASIQAFYPLSRFRRVEGYFGRPNGHTAAAAIRRPASKPTTASTSRPCSRSTSAPAEYPSRIARMTRSIFSIRSGSEGMGQILHTSASVERCAQSVSCTLSAWASEHQRCESFQPRATPWETR